MNNILRLVCTLLILSSCAHKANKKVKPRLLMEVEGLSHCESVVFDSQTNHFYVSVQADQKKGDGYIAKVSPEGKITKLKFSTGLNNPKGLLVHDEKIYVSDVTKLVVIDLVSGKRLKEYKGDGAKFLNDVAVDESGNIYVSDMFTSAIYQLTASEDKFIRWYRSARLENPNGLLVKGDTMYVGAWGRFSNGKPLDAPRGRFLKININTKKIESITNGKLGNLDGVQSYNDDSFLVSDWVAGKIFKVSSTGARELVLETEQSVGDIYYSKSKRLMVLPMNKQSKLMFYKF